MTVAISPDERAREFDRHRPLLFSVAYRMLGSASDADDVLQDAYLRWERHAAEPVESPKAYLVTIVSRLCINQLKSARVRRERYVGRWLPEPVPTDTPDAPAEVLAGESLSYAFMLVLERLNPVERAAFILRDVFDYDYAQIATIINRSEENCRQLVHRAHLHVKQERKRFDASSSDHDQLLKRFVDAALHGEMDGLLRLLSRDVALYADGGGKAPAVPNIVFGADHVARLMLGALRKFVPEEIYVELRRINGQPAAVAYAGDRPATALIVSVAANAIAEIYIMSNPEKLRRIARKDRSQSSF